MKVYFDLLHAAYNVAYRYMHQRLVRRERAAWLQVGHRIKVPKDVRLLIASYVTRPCVEQPTPWWFIVLVTLPWLVGLVYVMRVLVLFIRLLIEFGQIFTSPILVPQSHATPCLDSLYVAECFGITRDFVDWLIAHMLVVLGMTLILLR